MTEPLAQTPLFDWHAAHGGRLVDFAGWSMPVQYSSIVDEHAAVRTKAGIFDVSHMGRLRIDGSPTGDDVSKFLDGVTTRRVADMKPGQIRYSLVTNDAGGILDDILVYRLQDATGGAYHLLVVNASNREKIVAWLQPRAVAAGVRLLDITRDLAMIAVQGPSSRELVQPLVELPLDKLRYYQGAETEFVGKHSIPSSNKKVAGLVSRTGYTGEDGWELIVPADAVVAIWRRLVDAGVTPCGLASRDTLRLEAGMPLYGHELNEQIDPFQAGLSFAVNLEGRDFPGHAALQSRQNDRTMPHRVGLALDGKRVPREGYAVMSGDKSVGHVTSGTFSPTFNRPIAMAYVTPEFAKVGTELSIDIRGRGEPCKVVPLPFYRREH